MMKYQQLAIGCPYWNSISETEEACWWELPAQGEAQSWTDGPTRFGPIHPQWTQQLPIGFAQCFAKQ